MEKQEIVFNQCRFCLKLIEPLGSFSIFGDSEDSQQNLLHDFVQKLLSIEFTAENSHVCSDCFSMWRMIQDYLYACVDAHKIVLASKKLIVRKPWLENEEEKRMLIGICRVVKKLYHETEIQLRMVQPPAVSPSDADDTGRRRRSRKRKRSVENGTAKGKEKYVSSETVNDAIKEEDPVEIDDSAAFQSDKPLEATKEVLVDEGNDDPEEAEDDSILDDSIAIIELPMDYVDLVDSSSEESEGTEVEEESVYIMDRIHDEETFNTLKTVCQLCGITTSDMANHLESHIKESDTEKDHRKQNQKHQMESDSSCSSNSSSSNARQLKPKPKNASLVVERPKVAQPNSLKCNVCGVGFTSMLTARLHARLHPVKRTYNSIKSNKMDIKDELEEVTYDMLEGENAEETSEFADLLLSFGISDHVISSFLENGYTVELLKVIERREIEDLIGPPHLAERTKVILGLNNWRQAQGFPAVSSPPLSSVQNSPKIESRLANINREDCTAKFLIQSSTKGRLIIDSYRNTQALTKAQRTTLTHIVVDEFKDVFGKLTRHELKLRAAELKQLFPSESEYTWYQPPVEIEGNKKIKLGRLARGRLHDRNLNYKPEKHSAQHLQENTSEQSHEEDLSEAEPPNHQVEPSTDSSESNSRLMIERQRPKRTLRQPSHLDDYNWNIVEDA